MNGKTKKLLTYAVTLLLIPVIGLAGKTLFGEKQYAWVCLCMAVLACIPFFSAFERGKAGERRMLIIAVMTATSVVGRIVFSPIPGFKPVTAVVIVTAMYFGSEAGFVTGALTAVISNLYFGQGPWTPIQMVVWGLIGFFAGVLSRPLVKSNFFLILYGAAAGVAFSLLMDVWTVIWWDGGFNLTRYKAALIAASGFTMTYAVSNAVFLLVLVKPLGAKFERIKNKYGL